VCPLCLDDREAQGIGLCCKCDNGRDPVQCTVQPDSADEWRLRLADVAGRYVQARRIADDQTIAYLQARGTGTLTAELVVRRDDALRQVNKLDALLCGAYDEWRTRAAAPAEPT
jgi:hypothetical protein